LGLGTYNSERSFVNEDIVFSSTKGLCLNTGLGLGYHIAASPFFSINIRTEMMINFTDAWDGYDNGKGTDFLLRSGLSFIYTFSKSTMRHQKVKTPG
jgi:hypothetical protein